MNPDFKPLFSQKKLDGFFIFKPENVFWLSGFRGSFGFILLHKNDRNFLVSDARYFEKIKILAAKKNFEPILLDQNFSKNFAPQISGRFGVENSISLAEFKWLRKTFSACTFRSQNSLFEKMRSQKTSDEIECTRRAAAHVDSILEPFFRQKLKTGVSEKSLAFDLELAIRDGGNFELAFDPIVAFGTNSAVPHHEPSEKILEKNTPILVDCGAKFLGFCSDITRNFFFGEPNRDYSEVFQTLLEKQKKTLPEFRSGKKCAKLDSDCRAFLGENAAYFTHSLGHGTGLEIHESPAISAKSKDVLMENQIVTCEPGLYFPQKFGIRIEDQLLVGAEKSEILTKTSKDLLVIR